MVRGLVPRPTPKLEATPCRLSATAYSIYSQLPSVTGGLPSIHSLRTRPEHFVLCPQCSQPYNCWLSCRTRCNMWSYWIHCSSFEWRGQNEEPGFVSRQYHRNCLHHNAQNGCGVHPSFHVTGALHIPILLHDVMLRHKDNFSSFYSTDINRSHFHSRLSIFKRCSFRISTGTPHLLIVSRGMLILCGRTHHD